FAGDAASGWAGDGSQASPYRLEFDGVDDHVTIPAGSVPELMSARAAGIEAWFRTGSRPASTPDPYLMEWLQGVGRPQGMSVANQNGQLRTYTADPYWVDVAPVDANTLYHVLLVKQPGEVRVYLNGERVFTGVTPDYGTPNTEIVLG